MNRRRSGVSGKISKMTGVSILTAIIVIIQIICTFIKFGPFAISLVLIPIVLGAALCGPKVSTWLGFVFGVAVLFTDAGAFLAISVIGTVVTVLAKGALCGLAAGIVYKVLENKNRYVAVTAAAVVCPIVNTGIFLLGCAVFFMDTIQQWGAGAGFENVAEYLIVGMVGVNFIVELATNVVLSPVVVRLLSISKKLYK